MDVIRKFRWPLLATGITLLLYLLLWFFDSHDEPTTKAATVWPVTAQSLTAQDHTPQLRIYARAYSPATSQLIAQVDAPVQRILVRDGDHVKDGQLMITLNDHKAQLNVQQHQAALTDLHSQLNQEHTTHAHEQQSYQHELTVSQLAKQSLDRFQTLYTKNLVSAAQVEQQQDELATQTIKANTLQTRLRNHQHRTQSLHAKIKQQQTALEQAKIELNDTKIYAPYTGRIIKIALGVGQHVRKGDTMLSVFNPKQLELRGQIPLPYLHTLRHQLALQRPVQAVSTHKPITHSRLTRLASSIDSGDVAVDGIFQFTDTTPKLAIGRVIALDLSMPTIKQSFVLPSAAIYHNDQVFLIKDNKLKPITITPHGPSKQQNQMIITSSQLHTGDQILTMQLSHAGDGTAVTIVNDGHGNLVP